LTTALAAAFAAACLSAVPALAGTPCGPAGYAYAGVQSLENGHGISARVTSLATPAVESGHVAGWIGIGAPGEGPGGSDTWLQVGLNSLPGTGNTLYYEVMRPFMGRTEYVEIARNIPSGKTLKLAILEQAGQPSSWRVMVNARPVSPVIQLQGSHLRLTPMAMAESWDGGRPVCNRYAYKYDQVALATAPGGPWQQVGSRTAVLQDPGYRVARTTASSFVASATRPLPAEPAPAADTAAPGTGATGPQTVRTKAVRTQVVLVKPLVEAAPLRKGVLPVPVIAPVQTVVVAEVEPAAAPLVSEPVVSTDPLAPADPFAADTFLTTFVFLHEDTA
jgi:hypothetical protein